jgi:putative methionine-R-sulfoxide reductase with GAF domain
VDQNEAKNAGARAAEEEAGKDRQKPDEILSYMSKSMDFIKELMEDNERLRYRVVQLQEENFELSTGTAQGQRAEILLQQLEKLEAEKDRLVFEYKRVEDENMGYAARYVDIEEENNNLANLYVCSFQLHSTLDFREVIQIIMEIIINLIGGEDYGIFLLDDKTQALRPMAMEGLPLEGVPPVPVGKGVIGQAVMTGENYYHPDIHGEQRGQKREVDDPLVCVPLKIKDSVIGVITLYKLLPQKTLFANVDYELFTLLAGHAATAIFSSKLYSEAQRKLHTIKGFMELLTSSEK